MSQINIEIIHVVDTVKTTARGAYHELEVTYKNKSFQDKVESKKIIDVYAKDAYNILKNAQFGDTFNIVREKNEKGFWDWIKILNENDSQFNAQELQESQEYKKDSKVMDTSPNKSPRSTYETPEERAARQIMIVRQSSVSSAIMALKTDKIQLNANEVVDLARQFEQYVLNDIGGTDKFASMTEDPI